MAFIRPFPSCFFPPCIGSTAALGPVAKVVQERKIGDCHQFAPRHDPRNRALSLKRIGWLYPIFQAGTELAVRSKTERANSPQTDLTQVGAVSFGDGQRFVERSRIHILLDGGPAVIVDFAQDVANSREIDDAFGKVGKHTHTDSFDKRDFFGFDFRVDQSVYAFEVEIAYAMVMPTDETLSPP